MVTSINGKHLIIHERVTMPSENLVVLMGNLTRNVDLKKTPNGISVGDGGLAVNRKYRDDQGQTVEETTFVDFSVFGKSAETMHQYLSTGSPVYIRGRLKLDEWHDSSGKRMTKLKVVVVDFRFLGESKKRLSNETQHEAPGVSRPPQNPNPQPETFHDAWM